MKTLMSVILSTFLVIPAAVRANGVVKAEDLMIPEFRRNASEIMMLSNEIDALSRIAETMTSSQVSGSQKSRVSYVLIGHNTYRQLKNTKHIVATLSQWGNVTLRRNAVNSYATWTIELRDDEPHQKAMEWILEEIAERTTYFDELVRVQVNRIMTYSANEADRDVYHRVREYLRYAASKDHYSVKTHLAWYAQAQELSLQEKALRALENLDSVAQTIKPL